jgi:hypothetical protein
MDLYLKRSRTPRIALPAMMEEADENTEILIRFETTPEERERVRALKRKEGASSKVHISPFHWNS